MRKPRRRITRALLTLLAGITLLIAAGCDNTARFMGFLTNVRQTLDLSYVNPKVTVRFDAPGLLEAEVIEFAGKVWMLGGFFGPTELSTADRYYGVRISDPEGYTYDPDLLSINPTILNSDDGLVWSVAVADAPPTNTRFHGHTVVFNDELWHVGGRTYLGVTSGSVDWEYATTAWHSTDGVNWVEVPTTGAPMEFSRSYGKTLFVVYQSELVALTSGTRVFTSPNGVSWSEETTDPPIDTQSMRAWSVFNDRIWVYTDEGAYSWNGGPAAADWSFEGVPTTEWSGAADWLIHASQTTEFVVKDGALYDLQPGGGYFLTSSNGILWESGMGIDSFRPSAVSHGATFLYDGALISTGGIVRYDYWYHRGKIGLPPFSEAADTTDVAADYIATYGASNPPYATATHLWHWPSLDEDYY
jgi:hypothetical protein